MKVFVNEFKIKEVPNELSIYRVSTPQLETLVKNYRIPAIAARKLTEQYNEPISSLGDNLISATNIDLPNRYKIQIKHDGFPTIFELNINKLNHIKKGYSNFSEAVLRYLNRKIDLIMNNDNYIQEGRYFFSDKEIKLATNFYLLRGIYITTKSYNNDIYSIIADSVVGLRSKSTLLDDLNRVLKQEGITSWREVGNNDRKINAIFWSRAPRFRTIYSEIRGYGEPGVGSYRFRGFDFTRSVADSVGDKISPSEWHKKFDREVDPDQPVVKVIAKGPYIVDQVPALLEEQPTFEKLKRILQSSREAHTRALLSSLDRILATSDALQPLVQTDMIDETPMIKEAVNYAPVEFDIGGDYINISRNRDFFTKYFEKKKVLKKPDIERIFAITVEKESKHTKRILNSVINIGNDFNLDMPEPKIFAINEENLVTEIIDIAKENSFSRNDLVFIIMEKGESEYEFYEDDPYFIIKKYSLSEQIFPTQFLELSNIKKSKNDKSLDIEVGRQVFLQIVAKCNGEPWGFAPDFAITDTLFIALDNYRDPFGVAKYNGASCCIFDWKGKYLFSNAVPYKYEDWLNVTETIIDESLSKINTDYNGVIFLRDSRKLGATSLENEIQTLNNIFLDQGINLDKLIHVCSNQSSHYRIFTSDGQDILTAGTAPPLTTVLDMIDPSTFLTVSTEPIFSMKSQREMGTPRPVLYEIISPDNAIQIKDTLAKALAWLCRHSWCSPVFMRIPAPLDYAKKVSSLVAKMGKEISPLACDAPLYL